MLGQTISHYRITDKLGEGGMGVVYKAEDTKLERTVALKFLAAHLVSDEEIRKRFEREAKAAAALNHPNICHVYEIDEADGKTFIAMAFIEGQGLDKKIATGPLKLNEALDIAHQIAQGLQAAHGKKIVHRDIKPANVMVTGAGSLRQVTIMDFGLAQLSEHSKLTRKNETLGTVAYMSPEQTAGAEVDHRSDIWALGCVLYELVSGQQPFKGHYNQAVMYSITTEEPEPLTALRTGVPMELEWIVGKCLAKDAESRYQHATDMAVDLKNLQEKLKSGRSAILKTSVGGGTEASVGARQAVPGEAETEMGTRAQHAVPLRPTWKRMLPWTLLAAMTVVALTLAFVHLRETPPPTPSPRRFSFTPESLQTGPQTRVNRALISPNGRYIVYATAGESGKLWVRDLDREEPRALEGTEGGVQPFWSPDSEFIGFVTEKDVRKVAVQGGPAITLCALPGPIRGGGAWSPDGETIVFSSGINFPVLHEVPARGGTPKLLFEPEKSEKGPGNTTPHFLPPTAAARSVLFGLGSATNRDVAIKNLMTGELRVLASGAFPAYSPSGHILYQTAPGEGGLWALPFSIETLQATGEAFPIAQNAANPSVAQDGTLVYTDFGETGLNQLVWRDRGGARLQAIGAPQTSMTIQFALSPDGGRVSLLDASRDIWVHDLGSGVKTRLTSDESLENYPLWSSTGREIAFASNRSSDRRSSFSIFSIPADGAGEPALLVGSELNEYPSDWSRDGRHLIYTADSGGPGGLDIWYLRRKPDGNGFESVPFLEGRFNQQSGKLSPDGRFLAYCSDESGRSEVYVRPFPEGGGQWPVSPTGGCEPRWSHDGKELFYVVGNTLMAAAVTTSAGFSAGAVVRLFQDAGLALGRNRYDVSADGKRFLMIEQVQGDEAKAPAIHIVLNWFEEFKDRQRD